MSSTGKNNFIEQLVYHKGEQRLREVERSGMHPDFAYREGRRWLNGKIAGALFLGLSLGGIVTVSHQLEVSVERSRIALDHIREARTSAIGDCLRGVIQNAGHMAQAEVPLNPLADCQSQVAAQEAYIHRIAFPLSPRVQSGH